jgi:hypothetical protein
MRRRRSWHNWGFSSNPSIRRIQKRMALAYALWLEWRNMYGAP